MQSTLQGARNGAARFAQIGKSSAFLVTALLLSACATTPIKQAASGFNGVVSPYVEDHPYLVDERYTLTQLKGNVLNLRYFRGCDPVCTGNEEIAMYELDDKKRLVWASRGGSRDSYEAWTYEGDSRYPSSEAHVRSVGNEQKKDTWLIQRDAYGNQLNLRKKPRIINHTRMHNNQGELELEGYLETWFRVDQATWLHGKPDPNADIGSRIDRFYIDGMLVRRTESDAPVTELANGRSVTINTRQSYTYEHHPNGTLKSVSTLYEVGDRITMVQSFAKSAPILKTEERYSDDGLLRERRSYGFPAKVIDIRTMGALFHHSSLSNASGVGTIHYTDYEFDHEGNWVARNLLCSTGTKQWACNNEQRHITYR